MSNTALLKCTDPRKDTCLMCVNGQCRALRDVKNCTFYKDKTQMPEAEIEYYLDSAWKETYRGADPKTVLERQKIGEIILTAYENAKGVSIR